MKVTIRTNLPISDLALLNLEKFFERYFNLYPEKMKGA